jgi:hypothetical protein
MKLFLIVASLLILGTHSFANPPEKINEKLLQDFKQNFPNAQNMVWNISTKTCLVDFFDDLVRTSIIYEKDGTFIRSIRYYKEQVLPYYIKIIVKKKYPEKKVFGVIEITTSAGMAYYVKLEDSVGFTTLKLDSEGNMCVVEKYMKAN